MTLAVWNCHSRKVSPPPRVRETKRSPRQILPKQYLPGVQTPAKLPLSGGTIWFRGFFVACKCSSFFCAAFCARLMRPMPVLELQMHIDIRMFFHPGIFESPVTRSMVLAVWNGWRRDKRTNGVREAGSRPVGAAIIRELVRYAVRGAYNMKKPPHTGRQDYSPEPTCFPFL